jgi:hypothetical protein
MIPYILNPSRYFLKPNWAQEEENDSMRGYW